jgi:hypothetical protein
VAYDVFGGEIFEQRRFPISLAGAGGFHERTISIRITFFTIGNHFIGMSGVIGKDGGIIVFNGDVERSGLFY